ncbi:uncharacterized protein LOC123673453 [Harmonia axyridis]|uniref:uncharacterized protein LOC123673453 n=1 Tax=Harmonia axyridis TaxID=115357 RepID=UPI001E277972|nr:uncharacterized protein LOC123673453 [Harmonia axyridis]
MKREKQRTQLISVQRRGLLRVASAYRTVSSEAAQVIAAFPPIDLMVAEACFLFKIGTRLPGNRNMARKRTLRMWQKRWEEGKTESDLCELCQVPDSPEHVYAVCLRFKSERHKVKLEMGRLPDVMELVETMTANKDKWNIMYEYITSIMRRKEEEDRRRQQEER